MGKTMVDSGTGKVVSTDDGHEAEPGHTIAAQRADEVFDPNAAWREKQGIGPGLQDSEALQPAVWPQNDEAVAVAQIEREMEQLDKRKEQLQADLKAMSSSGSSGSSKAESKAESK